jgi:hypothetical protein
MNEEQHNMYGETITNLATLATTADQDAVDEILDLLYRLKDEFARAQNSDANAESDAAAAHEDYVAEMNTTIQNREDHLATLRDKQANLEDEIDAAKTGKADGEAKRDTYINLIAEEEAACEEKRQAYFRESVERTEELDVVAQVEQIVNDRILTIDPYLEERVNV